MMTIISKKNNDEMKQNWKPGPMIYPLPVVIISSGKTPDDYVLFSASWVGTLSSKPPICYISLRPERATHEIIKRNMEFTINLASHELALMTQESDLITGREYYQFEQLGLTPVKGKMIESPIIKESPVNIECKVKAVVSFGSHDTFISEIVNLQINDNLIDTESETIDLNQSGLIAFSYGNYYSLINVIDKYNRQKKKP